MPVVVLVGRPNVGKSTLFNRLTSTRRAIVTPVPGTTRDVISQPMVWRGVSFQLTDTGGMFGASKDPLHELVFQHGRRALAAADLIVFVVDGREGKVPGDEQIAAAAREAGVPVILVINKTDDRRARDGALDFYQLGFEETLEISAEHGHGVGELLDSVVEALPGALREVATEPAQGEAEGDVEAEGTAEIRVAIVGRPNVGTSSLVNRLLHEERVLVSEVPGTTRDAVDVVVRWHRRQFRIVDTAGIRRAGRVARGGQVEAVSVVFARRAIEEADVAVVLFDAVEGPTDQDAAIAGEADRAGRGIIVAVNKWDLVKGRGPEFAKTFDAELRRKLKFLEYAPLLHISALTGERTPRLLETIDKGAAARRKRVPTAELNRFVEAVTAVHPPASPTRRHVRILYAAQVSVAPPSFVFFTNVATTFHFSYERFLVNRLREAFGFEGSPLRIDVRARASKT
ncbi:MAG: ribosome biogenesis GTPase Der [Acidobacteria bacterium]|nr:MAG: ribosome biogenesis GTPase Der [Acidobacteriota bacterium]